jgi:hypothetical protein
LTERTIDPAILDPDNLPPPDPESPSDPDLPEDPDAQPEQE